MNSGLPPTLRKARTGEFTPPGMSVCARRNRSSDLDRFMLTGLARHHVTKPEAHAELVEAAVQIPHQPLLESQIRLLPGKQVLHDSGKPRTAAGELHHPRGHAAQQEAAEEDPLGKPGTALEGSREVPPDEPVI